MSRTHHPPFPTASCRNLPLGAPDVLEEAVTLSEAVQGIVALAHGADETGQSVDDVLALDGPAVLVDLGDGDLARTVVLGLDDSARRRALAGDVTGRGLVSVRLRVRTAIRGLSSSRASLQVDDFTTVVLHLCDLF